MNRCTIEEYLHNKGIKRRYKGFKYWVDAILIAYTDNDFPCKMMPIYTKVARRHGATVVQVERTMRYAVHRCGYEDTAHEFLAESVAALFKPSRPVLNYNIDSKDVWPHIKELAKKAPVDSYDTYIVADKVASIMLDSNYAYCRANKEDIPHRSRKALVVYMDDFKRIISAIENGSLRGDENA